MTNGTTLSYRLQQVNNVFTFEDKKKKITFAPHFCSSGSDTFLNFGSCEFLNNYSWEFLRNWFCSFSQRPFRSISTLLRSVVRIHSCTQCSKYCYNILMITCTYRAIIIHSLAIALSTITYYYFFSITLVEYSSTILTNSK